jgi:hypothetical protein
LNEKLHPASVLSDGFRVCKWVNIDLTELFKSLSIKKNPQDLVPFPILVENKRRKKKEGGVINDAQGSREKTEANQTNRSDTFDSSF